ncbi:carcinoembryonic antigen-related cell adhesion molecule 20-like [Hoplias malabaricus]|uniref:carcinoembryonic antigen-related cell adhesion molecule 20-like n=1 Tax=Hoplias malabaricus TaxID=27720 RepID=UPI0034623466
MDWVLLTTLTIALLTDPMCGVVILGPEDVLIEDISSANLSCVGNDPFITAEWTKDDQVLSPSNRVQFSADNTSVLIRPVKRSDSGQYSCTLSSGVSSGMANYSMTVYYGPDVQIVGGKKVEDGSDIVLFCSIDSLPAATISWIVNGEIFGHSLLLISEKINKTHSGTYTCSAFNNVTGVTSSTELFLTVTDKDCDSGLGPGEAAGITVAVIAVLGILAVGVYFLVMYVKNTSEPVCNLPKPKENKQSRKALSNSRVEEDNELKTTPFKHQQRTSVTPGAQYNRQEEPVYENKPHVPRHAKPRQLPHQKVNASPQKVPNQASSHKKHSSELVPPTLPLRKKRVSHTDPDIYCTTLEFT